MIKVDPHETSGSKIKSITEKKLTEKSAGVGSFARRRGVEDNGEETENEKSNEKVVVRKPEKGKNVD